MTRDARPPLRQRQQRRRPPADPRRARRRQRGHVPGTATTVHAPAEGGVPRAARRRARVFFAFNGTGANVVALAAALRPYQAVICPQGAHLDVDECGAYERFAGGKLIDGPGRGRQADPGRRRAACMRGIGDPHHVQPAGDLDLAVHRGRAPCYTLDELRALARSRASTACFSTWTARGSPTPPSRSASTLRTLLAETGVDVLTFGGTKNGLMFGEAIVFLRDHPALARLPFARKQGDAARLEDALRRGAVRGAAARRPVAPQRRARQRDGAAARRARVRDSTACAGVPGEANGVFAQLAAARDRAAAARAHFYIWDAAARWRAGCAPGTPPTRTSRVRRRRWRASRRTGARRRRARTTRGRTGARAISVPARRTGRWRGCASGSRTTPTSRACRRALGLDDRPARTAAQRRLVCVARAARGGRGAGRQDAHDGADLARSRVDPQRCATRCARRAARARAARHAVAAGRGAARAGHADARLESCGRPPTAASSASSPSVSAHPDSSACHPYAAARSTPSA